jgi:DNA-binding phage protein
VTLDGLLAFLRLEVERAGGLNALGRKWGICSSHLSRVLRKQKIPGPVVLTRLGFRERIEYEPDVRRRSR